MLTIRTRGYLPHWELPGSTYSVTFRLADSLPQSLLRAYQQERQHILNTAAQLQRNLTRQEHDRLDHLFSSHIEQHLDRGIGQCHLRHPEIAQSLTNILLHFHTTRYDLLTWCIKPNHVHTLVRPHAPHTLDTILHSWKSFSATAANRLLSRRGTFWMPEYHDHLIRDQRDLTNHHHYILNNPTKAHLQNWPWLGTTLPNAHLPSPNATPPRPSSR